MVELQAWRDVELQKYMPDPVLGYLDRDCAWGVVKQTDDKWAVLLNTPGGILTLQELKAIVDVMEMGGSRVKLSSRQAPMLLLREEKLEESLRQLEKAGLKPSIIHGSLRNVKACIGKQGCKNSRRYDVQKLARVIDQAFFGVKLPGDLKIAVSGCSRNCAAANCQCIGLVENRDGFSVYLGGAENELTPVHGTCIAGDVPKEKVVEVIEAIIKCYIYFTNQLTADGIVGGKPRLYEIIGKAGAGYFKQAVQEVLVTGTPGALPGEDFIGLELTADPAAETAAARDARSPGFTKENAFQSFVVLNKLCVHCPECKRFKCQVYIAKEHIVEVSRTGQKYLPHIPSDIFEIIRSLPVDTKKFDVFSLHEAFHTVNETCDHCRVADHDLLCAANVALTAIGCLIRGREFETHMDRQRKELHK